MSEEMKDELKDELNESVQNEIEETPEIEFTEENPADPEIKEESAAEDEKKEKKTGKLINSFKTKNFRFGMYSSSLTAIVIVVVILLNIAAAHLPGSLNSIDLSTADIYSIGEQTENLLDELEDDITISVLASEDSADENINNLLERYEKASKHITVKYIDTNTDIGASEQYSNYSANSLIVSCETNEIVIDYYSIYQTDYSDYYTTGTASTSFDGEGQITSAIYKLTSGESPMIYCVTGHGESSLGSSVSSMISKQNMVVSDLNLLASDVPDDCEAVIINGPTEDFAADETQKLADYISNGGNVMILLAYTENSMTELKKLMNTCGVQTVDGIVMETSNNSYNYPINIFAGIESTDITEELASEKANILMTESIGLKTTETDDLTITELLSSSDGAYAKTPSGGQFTTLEKESGDTDGPFSLAVMSEDEETGGKLAVISSETLIEDYMAQYPVANIEFFVNCIVDMCGDDGTISAVSIEPKSLDIEYMTISSLHAMIWMAVCIILIPLTIFITGLVIWLSRRKR
jgi:ABC-2 type transport system permease protein